MCVWGGGGAGIVNKIFFYPLPLGYLWEYKLAQGISVISKYKPYWLATGSPVSYLAAFFLRVRVRVNILNWLNSTDAIVPLFFIHVFAFLFAVFCLGFIWRNCRRHLLSSEERWQGHSKQVGSFFRSLFFSPSTTFQCIGYQLLPLQEQDPSGACFFDQSLQTLTEFNDVMRKESRYVRHRVQNRFYVIISVISGIIAIIWNPHLSVQWRRVLCLESNLTYMTNWLALGKMLKTLHKSFCFFFCGVLFYCCCGCCYRLLMHICVFFL